MRILQNLIRCIMRRIHCNRVANFPTTIVKFSTNGNLNWTFRCIQLVYVNFTKVSFLTGTAYRN